MIRLRSWYIFSFFVKGVIASIASSVNLNLPFHQDRLLHSTRVIDRRVVSARWRSANFLNTDWSHQLQGAHYECTRYLLPARIGFVFYGISCGTRDSSAASAALAGPRLLFDPYFIILPRRHGGRRIRLQILLRLDCQLAEKIRFIGIVGNLDDPLFLRIPILWSGLTSQRYQRSRNCTKNSSKHSNPSVENPKSISQKRIHECLFSRILSGHYHTLAGSHDRWQRRSHSLLVRQIYSLSLNYEGPFRWNHVFPHAVLTARNSETSARAAHSICHVYLPRRDRSLDQSPERVNREWNNRLKRASTEQGDLFKISKTDLDDDHDPQYILNLARIILHQFPRREDHRTYLRMYPSQWEPVDVAVTRILHLAVASAGGRVASTRRK